MLEINLQPLKSESLPSAVRLYEAAFPRCERRDTETWLRFREIRPNFRVFEIASGSAFVGFISVWAFPGFVYVEHFAVDENFRGNGCGGTALDMLCRQLGDRPVVLEVELPETELAGRRVGFYERHGFKLSAETYRQPPYHEGEGWLPMRLMTTKEAFLQANFASVCTFIYKEVYGCKAFPAKI